MRKQRLKETVKSDRGFYIGDICYVLSTRDYHRIWGDRKRFSDGKVDIPGGLSFSVASTNFGDGLYEDEEGNLYPVDAAVIGIVPLELVAKEDGLKFGRVVETPGEAVFEAEDGVFDITLPDNGRIHIDTRYMSDSEYIITD